MTLHPCYSTSFVSGTCFLPDSELNIYVTKFVSYKLTLGYYSWDISQHLPFILQYLSSIFTMLPLYY